MSQVSNKHKRRLKLRLWFSGLTLVHLGLLGCRLLTIDFKQDEDPQMRMYHHVRWKLITCWFNLLMLAYYPLSFYCDWRELRLEQKRSHVRVLNRIRHVAFCSILLPTTIFADTLFWRLWNKDREMLAPPAADKYVGLWTHHCMHTVSLAIVLVDFAIVPRQRPRSLKLNLVVMMAWVTTYLLTVFASWMQGIYVYPLFGTLTMVQIVVFVLSMYTEHLLYFFLQWCVLDLISRSKNAVLDANKTMTSIDGIRLNKKTKYL